MNDITLPAKKTKSNKIVIRPTPNADSRTSNQFLTEETCREDTLEHVQDVQKAMNFFSAKIARAGLMHDNTKVVDMDEYIGLVLNDVKDDEFLKSDWWVKHITKERHHLNANCPVDVNLIDVLEMIADMVMQKGRKGYFTSDELKIIDPTLLERAYWNTVKLLDDNVLVR